MGQTIAAQHAVFMLGNTLAAIEIPAFRTTDDRFAVRMDMAMLIDDRIHKTYKLFTRSG
jgi:hypothetical protein